jgi:hypothetical protein
MSYVNKTINDGPYGSFMADAGQAAIGIYVRCKFVDPAGATPDGKPLLQVCGAADRADVVTMQPIAPGAYGTVKFANAAGEQFGKMSGNCASGVALYGAASGKVSTVSTSATLIGKSTSIGADGGTVTYASAVGVP